MKILALALGATYLVAAGVVALGYRAFLYPAKKDRLEPSTSAGSLVRIEKDGEPTVFAIHAPAPPGAPTLVLFHGNGEDLVDEAAEVRSYRDLGVGVLAVEYPGYGLAHDQTANEATIYATADRAIAWLRGQGVARDATVLVGFSLGSGVAVEMAKRDLAARVVLLAPYTSIPAMVARFVPILPTSFLIGDRFDTLAKAPSVVVPVLLIHGDADALIPLGMGERVASALPNAQLHVVRGGHHNDLSAREPGLRARIVTFARNAG